MQLVPPGPDGDDWIARLRDQIERDGPDLSGPPPFTVLGLATPALSPAVLAEWQAEDSDLTEVELVFGAPLSATGPYLSVRSEATGGHPHEPADLIADERVRLADLAGIEDPAPGASRTGEAVLGLDGRPLPLPVRHEGPVWAAAFAPPGGGWVSVVARGVPVTGVALATVADLGPFWAGWSAHIAALAGRAAEAGARMTGPQEWDLPPALSVQAYETLIAATLADRGAFPASDQRRRRPPRSITTAEMWEVATRAQMALAGQDRRAATEAVTSMVNHLGSLVDEPWFGEPRLRAAALAETIGWTAFGTPVRSQPAQRAWSVLWAARAGLPPPDLLAETMIGQPEWSAAWQTWAQTEH